MCLRTMSDSRDLKQNLTNTLSHGCQTTLVTCHSYISFASISRFQSANNMATESETRWMTQVSWLDAVLTLAGNRLSSRLFGFRCMGLVANWIMRGVITSSYLFGVYTDFVGRSSRFTSTSLAATSALIVGELLLLYFAFKRTQVKQLMKRLLETARPETVKRVQVVGCSSFIVIFTVMVTQEVLSCFAIKALVRDTWTTVRLTFQVLPTQMNQFFIVYPTLYLIVLRLASDADVAQLETMQHLVKIDARKLLTERKRTAALWQEFEQLFNVVPFMVIGILYLTIPGIIVGLRQDAQVHSPHLPYSLASFIIFHVIIVTQVLLLIFAVTRAQDRVREASERLIDKLQLQSCSSVEEASARHSLEKELRQQQPLTGCRMFTVDPSLLLSFAASVITFSVLLIQLQEPSSPMKSA